MTAESGRQKGAEFLLMAASVVIVIAGIKAASSLILPFLVSTFLGLVTLPLLNWLQRKKVPKPAAVLITLVVAIGVLVGAAVLIAGSLSEFTAEAPKYRQRLEGMYADVLAWVQARGIEIPAASTLTDMIRPGQAFDAVAKTLRGAASVLSNLLMVFLIIVFILFEAAGFPDKLRAAFGQQQGSERYEKIRAEIQRYLATKTIISLTTGLLVWIGMAIIGVDFALLWACLAFMLNYIPNLGSIIAAIPPVLLAAVQLGPGSALAVALLFVGVNVTLGNLLEPYLMGRRLGLSTLVIFLSLVFWGWVWGPVGMLLSVPLTMILKIMLENTEDLRWVAVLLSATPRTETPAAEQTDGGAAKS